MQLNSEDDPDKIAQIKYLIQRIENQNREKKKVEKETQTKQRDCRITIYGLDGYLFGYKWCPF